MKPTREAHCKLRTYGKSETLDCLDNLVNRVKKGSPLPGDNGDVHFAFIGDSKIRQLFYDFIKVIYDLVH